MRAFKRSPLLTGIALILCLGRAAVAADPPAADYIADALRERIVGARFTWGSLGLNTAVKPRDREARALRIGETTYQRGLGMHANGEVTILLAGEYQAFEGEVGMQWQGGESAGSVVFQVFVEIG
ncbi:MAG: NPCBM/NEW2 domain-containing protein, partial [Thermoguttaceae bacterium]|nr:NPCBM/NEW2 domain-containing protein [Thermoguttaceae bacterium]